MSVSVYKQYQWGAKLATLLGEILSEMTTEKGVVLGASLVLSVVSLVLLFGVTWYFQSSLSLLQQQVDNDRELLVKLQKDVEVLPFKIVLISNSRW